MIVDFVTEYREIFSLSGALYPSARVSDPQSKEDCSIILLFKIYQDSFSRHFLSSLSCIREYMSTSNDYVSDTLFFAVIATLLTTSQICRAVVRLHISETGS